MKGSMLLAVLVGIFFGLITTALALVLGVPAVIAGAIVGVAGMAVMALAFGSSR